VNLVTQEDSPQKASDSQPNSSRVTLKGSEFFARVKRQ